MGGEGRRGWGRGRLCEEGVRAGGGCESEDGGEVAVAVAEVAVEVEEEHQTNEELGVAKEEVGVAKVEGEATKGTRVEK